MNQSWERIQGLFLEALDLPPEKRASFLDAVARMRKVDFPIEREPADA